MNNYLSHFAELMAILIELIGISVIAIISVFVVGYFIVKLCKKEEVEQVYLHARRLLGRGILLGLEFLVAADIIHTVAVELNFKTVSVLAIIVLIRTFLSFTLELELTGRWPWQKKVPN